MEQRTYEEVRQSLIDKQPSKFPELSSSNAAEWSMWIDTIAYETWVFEGILAKSEASAEEMLLNQRSGNRGWWVTLAYNFQLGYNLEVDDNGLVKYPIIDESAKIIKRCSYSESNGVISLKVAKIDDQGELAPLSTDNGELLQFQRYIERGGYGGCKVNIVSLNADTIKYDMDIYFDPVYLESTILSNLQEKLNDYRLNLNDEGMFYRTEFLNKILSSVGVVTAKINSLQGTHGETTEDIDVRMLLTSGYYNYDETSVFNLINANA